MVHVVPPVALVLAKHAAVDEYDLHHLQAIYTGAAPIGHDVCTLLAHRLPNLRYVMQCALCARVHFAPPAQCTV
jgi:hypothetical protein